jgi:GDP/UDP-N,N'-diacetylbacillosamine 2-epimerase (hydrolysing)
MLKNICIVSGSRAEYGLLRPLIKSLQSNKQIEVHLVITGAHLSDKFGATQQEILNDHIQIYHKVDIIDHGKNSIEVADIISKGVLKISKVLIKINPDLVILLGDRYEIFSAAIASYTSQIPIAHLHGGELTYGAYDEAFRHSITKMSYLHFVANDIYRSRVIQLGENPSRVFTVGGLGVDSVATTSLYSKLQIESILNLRFAEKSILVTYHPETLKSNEENYTYLKELLAALDYFTDLTIIITMPNADSGNELFRDEFKAFSKQRENVYLFDSLGQTMYLSCMKIVDVIVGNSSSGIIEAPSLKKATVNIGDRQSGRLKATSIIDCAPKKMDIKQSIETASSLKFKSTLLDVQNLYGEPGAVKKITKILMSNDLILSSKKNFYDLF